MDGFQRLVAEMAVNRVEQRNARSVEDIEECIKDALGVIVHMSLQCRVKKTQFAALMKDMNTDPEIASELCSEFIHRAQSLLYA